MCNALAALHADRHTGKTSSKGWIHADIKPENILVLGPPARYVLIDYDAAVQIGGRIDVTTAAYAPHGPEGSQDAGEMGEAAVRFDVYMLGATLAHAAALERLTQLQYRHLYTDDFEASAPARRHLNVCTKVECISAGQRPEVIEQASLPCIPRYATAPAGRSLPGLLGGAAGWSDGREVPRLDSGNERRPCIGREDQRWAVGIL